MTGYLMTHREAGSTALIKNWAYAPISSSRIKKGDLYVYVFGKVFCDDIFGYHWESDFRNAYYGGKGFDYLEPTGADPKHTSFGYLGWQAKPCEKGKRNKTSCNGACGQRRREASRLRVSIPNAVNTSPNE